MVESVILNTSDGLQGSVSVAYAYGKSEPQFTKINNWMMSVCREQGLLGRRKERDGCARPNLGMGRLALEFPPRQWPDGPPPSCFGVGHSALKKAGALFSPFLRFFCRNSH